MSEPTDKPADDTAVTADDTAVTADPTTALPDEAPQQERRPKPQVGTGHKLGLAMELEQ